MRPYSGTSATTSSGWSTDSARAADSRPHGTVAVGNRRTPPPWPPGRAHTGGGSFPRPTRQPNRPGEGNRPTTGHHGRVVVTRTRVVVTVLAVAAAALVAVYLLRGSGPGTPAPVSTADLTHPSGLAPTVDKDPRWGAAFVDDFDGSAPDGWYLYAGVPAGGNGGFWAPSHATVASGVLRLRTTRDAGRWVSAGAAHKADGSITYGKVQVRFRMAPAHGVSYALLLWPDSEKAPPYVEFGEDGGGDRTTTSATLHTATGGTGPPHLLGGDFSQWHTLGVEWTPGRLDYTLDGQVWASDIGAGVPTKPMHLVVQTQTWDCGVPDVQCPDATTPATTDLEVDWVTVQPYRGG
ncbi:MAG: family 16 glycosylhydrolase [Frankiales bacterium]|nr:family 16 glycosylhydrolase [Frankiales bacterium]